MYVDGKWLPAEAGGTRQIINPFDQSVVDTVAEGDAGDARRAIDAARRVFDEGDWPVMPAADRGRLVGDLARLIEGDLDELARLETLDTGKPIADSRQDMADIAGVFHYYGGLADKEGGRTASSPHPSSISQVVREPIGVCGQISPWNYPLLQASWKLAPALAAGNTVVVKPSEITPLTTVRVFELIDELDFPPGVANLVLGPGAEVGAELAANHQVDMISFTGGVATGQRIMSAASGNVKRVALELGGKNPNIVFADADFDTAVDYAMTGVYLHSGQVCSAGARLLVEDELYEPFVEELARRIPRIRLGNGFEEGIETGPLISEEHRAKVEDYIRIGQQEGARLVVGGGRPDDPALQDGFFVEPTLFADCTTDMRIVQEEVFGPVLTVERFSGEHEAVTLANDTIYGLAGAVWTTDVGRAQRMARRLRMGTVWINDFHPYFPQAEWGGFKQSGIGRELGVQGFEEYTETKHVYQNLDPAPLRVFKG